MDINQYKEEGIARFSFEATSKNFYKKQFYLKDGNHRFYEASVRLDIKHSVSSHDVYAADIFCQQSCYLKYIYSRSSTSLDNEINYVENIGKTVLDMFMFNCKDKSIIKKEAYFYMNIWKMFL